MPADAIRAATAADWPEIESLLIEGQLPLDGARDALDSFRVFEWKGKVGACAALEPYGDAWLLRSVAVRQDVRGAGIGTRLVRHLLATIDAERPIILVTTTAALWFQGFGFRPIERGAVPASVTVSAEFRGACPASATIMMRG